MPPPLSADRPAAQPPQRGTVDALISQTRRLRGDVDAVRRGAPEDGGDPESRWQRALCDLALHQLDDLDEHLAQLRDGPPPAAAGAAGTGSDPAVPPSPRPGSLLSRVGSAEWNLLTDEATWSAELYQILGRAPSAPALTLDELPALVHEEDRPLLAAMVTDCLIEGRPIDGELRILRPDTEVRTVHMMGEPVLGADGSTASMWAVLRDVSELRRCRRTVRETRDSLRDHRHHARTGHRLAVEPQEAALPPWHGPLRLPQQAPGTPDVAACRLPATTSAPSGGDWYDAFELPDGAVLFGVGDLAGHGPAAASGVATVIGAVRGMAVAGTEPGRLMGWLNQLSDAPIQPSPGTALCCRYRPGTRTLSYAQAGHPAPLLFRGGTGRVLEQPDGVALAATPHAVYGQAEETLAEGDLLLLHTGGLRPRRDGTTAVQRLLGLAPRLCAARTAEDCVRIVEEGFGTSRREESARLLVVRIVS